MLRVVGAQAPEELLAPARFLARIQDASIRNPGPIAETPADVWDHILRIAAVGKHAHLCAVVILTSVEHVVDLQFLIFLCHKWFLL